MKLNQTLEIERTLHDIEERANNNRLGMQVTQQVADYRAHGAKKDVDTLLAVANAVLDLLVDAGSFVRVDDVQSVIHEAMVEKETSNV